MDPNMWDGWDQALASAVVSGICIAATLGVLLGYLVGRLTH